MDIEKISVADFLEIINNIDKEGFSLNILKKMKDENKFENVFYLMKLYRKDNNLLTWNRGNFLLSKSELLRFLYKQNKISKKFLRELFTNEDFDNSALVFNQLERSNDLLKKNNKYKKHDTYWNALNYLYALYIFNNPAEYTYFFDDFMPKKIKEIEGASKTCFFKTPKTYETDFKDYQDIKIYYYAESERYPFEKAILVQEEEDKKDVLFKGKMEEIDDGIDYFIEVEDDVDKVKEYLKNLKLELTELTKSLDE